MAKVVKKWKKKNNDQTTRALVKFSKKKVKGELTKPLFSKIDDYIYYAPGTVTANELMDKALSLIDDQAAYLETVKYRESAVEANLCLCIGETLNILKTNYDRNKKYKGKGSNWEGFLRDKCKHISVRTCKDYMLLARTRKIPEFAVYGYTNMRDMQQLRKEMKAKAFTDFIERNKLTPAANPHITPKHWKRLLEKALKKEGISKKSITAHPFPTRLSMTNNFEGEILKPTKPKHVRIKKKKVEELDPFLIFREIDTKLSSVCKSIKNKPKLSSKEISVLRKIKKSTDELLKTTNKGSSASNKGSIRTHRNSKPPKLILLNGGKTSHDLPTK